MKRSLKLFVLLLALVIISDYIKPEFLSESAMLNKMRDLRYVGPGGTYDYEVKRGINQYFWDYGIDDAANGQYLIVNAGWGYNGLWIEADSHSLMTMVYFSK